MSRTNYQGSRSFREDEQYGFTRSGKPYSPVQSPVLSDGEASETEGKITNRIHEMSAAEADNQPRDRRGKF